MMEWIKILWSIFGWIGWNVIEWRIEKDPYDNRKKKFPWSEYKETHYDNWISSLLGVPLVLVLGSVGGVIHPFGGASEFNFEWNDFYYMASGFSIEVVIFGIKKWRKKTSAELKETEEVNETDELSETN